VRCFSARTTPADASFEYEIFVLAAAFAALKGWRAQPDADDDSILG
jgi:hypothetical protein